MIVLTVITVFLAVALTVYLLSVPRNFTVRKYTVKTDKFFGHIKAVHISDLHNVMWGEGQSELLDKHYFRKHGAGAYYGQKESVK